MGDCGRHVLTHYEVDGRAEYLSCYPASLHEIDLDNLAGALEDAWVEVIAENANRADNRTAYDSWQEQMQASNPD